MNPTQTPTDVSNQLVYVLTKEFQYHCLHLFEKYCPTSGGLYIKQSSLSIHGQLIEDSGLAEIFTLHSFQHAVYLWLLTPATQERLVIPFKWQYVLFF